MLKKVRKHMPW